MILAALQRSTESDERFLYRLSEMKALISAAGGDVLGVYTQARDLVHQAFYFGAGKVLEIADAVEAQSIDLVIVDGDLTPAKCATWRRELAVASLTVRS